VPYIEKHLGRGYSTQAWQSHSLFLTFSGVLILLDLLSHVLYYFLRNPTPCLPPPAGGQGQAGIPLL
jgi:hypothetical protein